MTKKNNLITGGCSFTEGHNLGEKGSWAYWLSEQTNMKLHNLAKGGCGNEFILQKMLSYLVVNPEISKDSVVMVGWSEPTRQMVFFESEFNSDFCTIQPEDFIDKNKQSHIWKSNLKITPREWVLKHKNSLYPFFSSLSYSIFKTYFSIITLKSYLDSNDIPYVFFDAINPTKILIDNSSKQFKIRKYANSPEYTTEHIGSFDSMLNNDIVNYIYDKNYITFNGLSMHEWLWKDGSDEYERLTYNNSGHPNETASKELAIYIAKEYERLYN